MMRWPWRKRLPDRYWIMDRGGELVFVVSPDGRIVASYGNNGMGHRLADDHVRRLNETYEAARSIKERT